MGIPHGVSRMAESRMEVKQLSLCLSRRDRSSAPREPCRVRQTKANTPVAQFLGMGIDFKRPETNRTSRRRNASHASETPRQLAGIFSTMREKKGDTVFVSLRQALRPPQGEEGQSDERVHLLIDGSVRQTRMTY